jgi:hypothetical protein
VETGGGRQAKCEDWWNEWGGVKPLLTDRRVACDEVSDAIDGEVEFNYFESLKGRNLK